MGLLWSLRPVPGSKTGLRYANQARSTQMIPISTESVIRIKSDSALIFQDEEDERPDSYGGHSVSLPGPHD